MSENTDIKMEYKCEEALTIIGNILRKYQNSTYKAIDAIEAINGVLRFVREMKA